MASLCECENSELQSKQDSGGNKVCPNSCDIVSVPCCDLEAHLMVCPLQPVACEYAEVGCDVKVPRRDLARHMEESQQQHLLSVTLLILRLTRENTEEKKRLLRMIEEKDKENQQLQNQLVKKDETIADLQTQLKQVQESLEAKIDNLQQQIVKYGEDTQENLKQHDKQVECLIFGQLYNFNYSKVREGFTIHDFTLTEFKKCQAQGGYGEWWSEPFYTHSEGYKFKLNAKTNGEGYFRGKSISLRFYLQESCHDDKLGWPVTVTAHVQLLNQLGDHDHHEKTGVEYWERGSASRQFFLDFIKLSDLGIDTGKNVQYLKNDSLRFRVYVKCKS